MPSSQVVTSERPSKRGRLPPQFEEDFVRNIVSHRFRSRLARHEAVDPRVVAHEQEPDGGAVAARNPRDEFAVGLRPAGVMVSTAWLLSLCRARSAKGSREKSECRES